MKFEEEPTQELVMVETTKAFLQLPKTNQDLILTAALEYETMNRQEKLIKARRDKLIRPIVEGATDTYGIEDTNGHLHLVMEKEGIPVEVVRTKKISRTLNEVSAESILRKVGLYDTCIQQVISWEVDEEKVIEAYQAGLLSAEDLDKMFSEKITWATSVKSNLPELEILNNLRKEIEQSIIRELPEITNENNVSNAE